MTTLKKIARTKIERAFNSGYIGQVVSIDIVDRNHIQIKMNHNLDEIQREYDSLENSASTVTLNSLSELDDYFTDYLENRPTTRQLLREYANAIVSNPYCSVDLEVAIDLLSKYYTEEERHYFWHYFRCLKAKAKAKAV
mgnify:FL=1